jgi:predicted Fe-Mo cluster-binding NifX family protein
LQHIFVSCGIQIALEINVSFSCRIFFLDRGCNNVNGTNISQTELFAGKREGVMRIAISIWEDKISPVLDTASTLLIIENETQKENSRYEVRLLKQDISKKSRFIQSFNIDVLICGAVSRQFSDMLKASGIEVISGISGPARDVLEAYQQGMLLRSQFFMPGSQTDRFDQTGQPHIFRSIEKKVKAKGGKNGGGKKSKLG